MALKPNTSTHWVRDCHTRPTGVLLSPPVRVGAILAVTSVVASCSAWPRAAKPPQPVPASIADPRPPDLRFTDGELVDDAIVRLTTPHVACTGTLISPKVVLTAHHCVAARDDYGDFLMEDVEPSDVHVELGGDYLPWAEVNVHAIVAPPCGYAAGYGDIALLVLKTELPEVPLKEVRLDEPPRKGEGIDPTGFGRCADSGEGVRRHARAGGQVGRVDTASLRTEAAVCPGDSGGPGVDADGRIVGVISSSAMDGKESTRNVTEFTRVDAFRDVFDVGLRIADGENPAELPPLSCPQSGQ